MNLVVTKVSGKTYNFAVAGPVPGTMVIKVRELSRDVIPVTFVEIDELDVVEVPFSHDYTFPNDNVYQVESISTPVEVEDTIVNVVVDDDVETALLKASLHILCSCPCVEWKKGKIDAMMYHFNSLAINYYTYLSIVNEQNADEFIFDQLTDDQLAELTTLQQVIDRTAEIDACVDDLDDLCKCS